MSSSIRRLKDSYPDVLGGVLVFVGFVLFIVVFLAVFPVLTDPVGTYDGWFPDEDDTAVVEATTPDEPTAAEPTAAFRFVAEAIVQEPPPTEAGNEPPPQEPEEASFTYRATFEDRSEPGDFEIVARSWDLGDGTDAAGEFVEHIYEGPGVYPVRLEIEDAGGARVNVEADIEIPEEGRTFDRVDAADDLDLSGIESAVEDAVGTLETSIADTLDTVGSTARSVAIVVLFALAAIATTVVVWRVTRSGILLLRPTQQMRLRVRSAEMHVDVGKTPLTDLAAGGPTEEPDAAEVEPQLIEV